MKRIATWWPALLVLFVWGAFEANGAWEAHKAKQLANLKTENTQLQTENKEIRHEAQSFADRPRTNTDRINKLCDWAADVAKSEGRPLKRLPVFCSQCLMQWPDTAGSPASP